MLSTVDACPTDSGYALIKGGAQRFRARFGVKLYGATNYYHYQCFSHVGAMRLIIYAFLRGAACCSSLPTRKHGQQTLMAIGDRGSHKSDWLLQVLNRSDHYYAPLYNYLANNMYNHTSNIVYFLCSGH